MGMDERSRPRQMAVNSVQQRATLDGWYPPPPNNIIGTCISPVFSFDVRSLFPFFSSFCSAFVLSWSRCTLVSFSSFFSLHVVDVVVVVAAVVGSVGVFVVVVVVVVVVADASDSPSSFKIGVRVGVGARSICCWESKRFNSAISEGRRWSRRVEDETEEEEENVEEEAHKEEE